MDGGGEQGKGRRARTSGRSHVRNDGWDGGLQIPTLVTRTRKQCTTLANQGRGRGRAGRGPGGRGGGPGAARPCFGPPPPTSPGHPPRPPQPLARLPPSPERVHAHCERGVDSPVSPCDRVKRGGEGRGRPSKKIDGTTATPPRLSPAPPVHRARSPFLGHGVLLQDGAALFFCKTKPT